MPNPRRSDYDVTNTVQVSSPDAVRLAIVQLFAQHWPRASLTPIERSFAQFAAVFDGKAPGYEGVDTAYHDTQHTLDITLAVARLMAGHDLQVEAGEKLGGERATLGVVMALFHDAGYVRARGDEQHANGAEFTRTHVTRGAKFLADWLPQIGLASWVPVATEILHFTGYERPFDRIRADDPRDVKLGHLLGTADMMAQMADRCYLEKCRDRLYLEFVLGGVALATGPEGYPTVKYASGLDLLRQTPQFMYDVRSKRLDGAFQRAYRYLEILYDGRNPYIEAIDRNAAFLNEVLRSESWGLLRRTPPVFAAVPDPERTMRGLMASYIRKVWAGEA